MSAVEVPGWVKHAIFYQIFPDRFARSEQVAKPPHLEPWDSPPTLHGFKGGDLLGVVERLDYLEDLGVNALYFNPVFMSAANHRYHTYDYYHADPLLGGNQALAALVDEAHRRGIRVVLDGVFNHASRGFFQFHHALENEHASPYIDWFRFRGFPLNAYDPGKAPNYAAWWNLHALPQFNIETPAVREFLWGVAAHWIDFGMDGWRLDVPEEIKDAEFWRELRRRVKAANPHAYLVGEIWHEAQEWLRGDRFDGVMNYPLARACLGFFIEAAVDEEQVRGLGYAPVPHLDAVQFAEEVDHLLGIYDPAVTLGLLNLLDSHDTARFLTLARGDETALRLAVSFLMAFPGAPCLYYGDEIGMEGARDPDCRRSFPWNEDRWNRDLRRFVRTAIRVRKAHPALREGSCERLHAGGDVYAFARLHGDDRLVAAFNVSRGTRTPHIAAPEAIPDGTVLRDELSGATVRVSGRMLAGLSLPPRSASIWANVPA